MLRAQGKQQWQQRFGVVLDTALVLFVMPQHDPNSHDVSKSLRLFRKSAACR
jgi:hypothetical protein